MKGKGMAAETRKRPEPVEFDKDSDLRRTIIESVGDEILSCYQCLKCSAGCPASFAMDMLPHQVIRAVLFGRKDRVLASRTLWVCASCETCTTRCPNGIDIAGVMDRLRQIRIESGKAAALPRVPLLHEVFLEGLRKRGRLHELSLMRIYSMKSGELREKLRSGAWRSDARLGTKLLWRGKLKLLATRCRDMDAVRKIFEKAEEIKGRADAEATRIYADTYEADPEFFEFWRSIESYRKILPQFSKTLTTDMEYFKYMYSQAGE